MYVYDRTAIPINFYSESESKSVLSLKESESGSGSKEIFSIQIWLKKNKNSVIPVNKFWFKSEIKIEIGIVKNLLVGTGIGIAALACIGLSVILRI